jgi:hypothetical protein
MKEEAPLGNPFIGEPRGGRPAKEGGWVASPCGHCPSTLSQCDGGSGKEEGSGEERRKWMEVMGGRPPILTDQPSFGLQSPLPFIIHHILIP